MLRERQHVPDWEHLFFVVLLLGFVVWYLSTSASASPTFSNLILIAPIGAVAVVLLLFIGAVEFRGQAQAPGGASVQTAASASASRGRFRSGSLATIAVLMLFFGLFVVAIPYAGFDVATFVFAAATMWLLGERRIMFLLGLALGIAAVLSIAALTLLTFPMPLTLARALWSGS
jgi:putative tricarboxylic transport membrane protein